MVGPGNVSYENWSLWVRRLAWGEVRAAQAGEAVAQEQLQVRRPRTSSRLKRWWEQSTRKGCGARTACT
jgi:hypothetical protein